MALQTEIRSRADSRDRPRHRHQSHPHRHHHHRYRHHYGHLLIVNASNSRCGFDSALYGAHHAPVDAPLSLSLPQHDWLPVNRRWPGLNHLWLTSQRLRYPIGWRPYEALATTWRRDRQLALLFEYLLHSLCLIHHALVYLKMRWEFLGFRADF